MSDDYGLTRLPEGLSAENLAREDARSVRDAVIVTLAGQVELTTYPISWSWSLGPEADSDHLTVFVPRDAQPALPAPYLVDWKPGARALFLYDHDGHLATRWARGDLALSGLYSWKREGEPLTIWEILDAAVQEGAPVEWRDGRLVTPHL